MQSTLVSAKGESVGLDIFYRALGKNSWRKRHLSNGLKERRKQVKTIFKRRVYQQKEEQMQRLCWSRNLLVEEEEKVELAW